MYVGLLMMGHAHNVFHMSMLKKYTWDSSHILPYAEIPLQADVIYEEQLAKILARNLWMLHNKETPMVKMRWENHSEKEATQELEREMHEKFLNLFDMY